MSLDSRTDCDREASPLALGVIVPLGKIHEGTGSGNIFVNLLRDQRDLRVPGPRRIFRMTILTGALQYRANRVGNIRACQKRFFLVGVRDALGSCSCKCKRSESEEDQSEEALSPKRMGSRGHTHRTCRAGSGMFTVCEKLVKKIARCRVLP